MGGLSDGSEVMKTQKHRVVATVVASPPQSLGVRKDGGLEEYYSLVCPQLLELLGESGGGEEAGEIRSVSCAWVRALSERSLVLSRRHIFDPVMAPLLALSEFKPGGECVLPTEEDLSDCVDLLHTLFVSGGGGDPSAVFTSHLEPCVPALLELHCFVCFGASHLRRPVKALLERYLGTWASPDAVAAVRFFAFRGALEGEEERCHHHRLRLLRPEVRFVAGGSGGAAARWSDGAEENFYVSDDEKAIALVDLVDGCSKDLSVELFMTLLQDLSRMMSRKGEKEKGEDMERRLVQGLKVQGEEQEKGAEGGAGGRMSAIEEKLLALNDELDTTMLEMRRQLMVIRLLGLLSEDEGLQERLAKDSSRLLSFVGLTVERAAITCRQRANPPAADPRSEEEADSDEGPSMMESQSVTMALTLLSLKATQQPRERVKAEEWEAMGGFLEDLRMLAKLYPEERARRLAGQMAKLVATHGVIAQSQVFEIISFSGKKLQ